MNKIIVSVLAIIITISTFSVVNISAAETDAAEKAMSEELIAKDKVAITTRDITDAEIAWVKQATGALIWAAADDARSDDEIIAQAKRSDGSLTGGTNTFAVMRGFGTALTPNTNGSKATITVEAKDNSIIMTITGKFSHFDYIAKEQIEEETEPVIENERAQIRVDAPKKMAVAFEGGTVCYGGETKEFLVGKEYRFQMCSVNWDNGIFDGDNNGIRGTVVYRMTVVHQEQFLELATRAKEEPERYTVKGIDVIDNVEKIIIINCDADDAHLETDVNNFFMAYRFHFNTQEEYGLKTCIEKVVNNPTESLSVNLPLGSTVTCTAYDGEKIIDKADILVSHNTGKGIYEDEHLTSVNDFMWGSNQTLEGIKEPVEAAKERIEYAK